MINFLMFAGIFLIFLGLPASIVISIIFKIKKKKVLVPAICIPASIFLGFFFLCIGGYLYGQTDEYKKSTEEREQSELEQLKEKTEEQEKHIKELEEKLENAEKESFESSIKEKAEPTAEPTAEPQFDFEYKKMLVKYLKHEVVVDSIDQTVLVVYYEFTNNSGENKTFDYCFDDTCFQNGVEVEHSYWHVNDESHNSGKEIQPGTTITVASSFVLGESRDAIELEITPWIGDKMLFEKTLELN